MYKWYLMAVAAGTKRKSVGLQNITKLGMHRRLQALNKWPSLAQNDKEHTL